MSAATRRVAPVLLTGAPGAGKTTLVPYLRVALPGRVITDADELHGPAGELAGRSLDHSAAAPLWPAYNRLWGVIVDIVVRSGLGVVLCLPMLPEEFPVAGGRWPMGAAGLFRAGAGAADHRGAGRRTDVPGGRRDELRHRYGARGGGGPADRRLGRR